MNADPVGSVGSGDPMLLGELVFLIEKEYFRPYLYTTKRSDHLLLTFWAIHTYLVRETYTTPRLLLDSPVPESGKTTTLELLSKICFRPVRLDQVSSPALLARLTAEETSTLFIDEADRALDPMKPGVRDLLAVLNSGYKWGGARPVLVPSGNGKWEVAQMSTFSPVAMAGNTPLLPEDTRSRCIKIHLLPDRYGEAKEIDWELLDPIAEKIRVTIEAAAERYREEVKVCQPELPEGCKNRMREKWKPLAKVAMVAGNTWAEEINQLIREDIQATRELAEAPEAYKAPHVQLMFDLYQLYQETPGFIPTRDLVRRLLRANPDQWSATSSYGKDLNEQRLGQIIHRGFSVSSERIGDSPRGYHESKFSRIWRQLGILPQKPTEPTENDGDLF